MWLSSLYNEPIKSPSLMGVGGTEKTSRGPALFAGTEGPEQGRKGGVSGKEERGELSWSNSKLHLVWKKTQIFSMTLLLPSMAWLYIFHVYFITIWFWKDAVGIFSLHNYKENWFLAPLKS